MLLRYLFLVYRVIDGLVLWVGWVGEDESSARQWNCILPGGKDWVCQQNFCLKEYSAVFHGKDPQKGPLRNIKPLQRVIPVKIGPFTPNRPIQDDKLHFGERIRFFIIIFHHRSVKKVIHGQNLRQADERFAIKTQSSQQFEVSNLVLPIQLWRQIRRY